jgi:hypothetical protein
MLLALIEDIRSDASAEFMQDGRGLLSDASANLRMTVADSLIKSGILHSLWSQVDGAISEQVSIGFRLTNGDCRLSFC